MPPKKRKQPEAAKTPEVWVSPDLMLKLKGAGGTRGVPMPQSPYLALADQFLGLLPHEGIVGKTIHRPTPHPAHKPKEASAVPEPPPRAMAAGAAGQDAVLTTVPPRVVYPKPPARPTIPPPPKLALSHPPARPNLPKLRAPKPPKLSFRYRRRKSQK